MLTLTNTNFKENFPEIVNRKILGKVGGKQSVTFFEEISGLKACVCKLLLKEMYSELN